MRVAATIALAPLPFALAGCGGGKAAGSSTAAAAASSGPLVAAAERTQQAGSEKVELTATVTLSPSHSIVLRGSGVFDQKAGTGRLDTTLGAANGQSTTLSEVFQGDKMWLASPLFAQVFTPGKSWLEIDLDGSARTLGFDFKGLTGQDPGDMLTELERTSTPTALGSERLGGVETTHYRAAVDPALVPKTDPVEELTKTRVRRIDAWVGADGLVHKVRLDYTALTDPTKTGRAHVVLDMSFSHFGTAVNTPPPPASATIDANDSGSLTGTP